MTTDTDRRGGQPDGVDLYGIANCSSVRAARAWFASHDVVVRFHDLRATPPARSVVAGWLARVGAETLLNRRSRTWTQLNKAERLGALENADKLLDVLAAHPTLIKRPVVVCPATDALVVGVDEQAWAALC